MASATSVTKHSMGDLTLHIVEFASLGTRDTYASGLPNVVGYWARAWAGTAVSGGVLVTEASGTFDITNKVDTTTATLFILSQT